MGPALIRRRLGLGFALLLVGASSLAAEEPISPRLAALQKAIATGESGVLDRFWQKVAQEGTPLVEPIEGAKDEVLVTYLWRGGDETKNVLVVVSPNDLATPEGIAGARLTRLPQTDLWYLSRRMRNDARFAYSLSVNDSLAPLAQATPAEEEARWNALIADPKNARSALDPQASLAELPAAPKQPWIVPHPENPAGRLEERTLQSERLGNERIVRVYTPPGYDPKGPPYPLAVILDGRTYSAEIPTPTILDNLFAAGRIPPMIAVFVANPSAESRLAEFTCNPTFVQFLTAELMSWVRGGWRVTTEPARTAIVGSSLGGLAAACAAVSSSETFGNVLSLSGSFYWQLTGDAEPEGVARRLATGPKLPLRFYLEAGLMEDRQRPGSPSLLTANRHLRDVLEAKGYALDYHEFNGGHSILNWRGSIAEGLAALFGTKGKR
ncbi:MAG TPA: enterochelin esterase [Thermoanaerobaculia bacterium]|nr:enterochelin esterase [Thermoanaerobaculia bacterium]